MSEHVNVLVSHIPTAKLYILKKLWRNLVGKKFLIGVEVMQKDILKITFLRICESGGNHTVSNFDNFIRNDAKINLSLTSPMPKDILELQQQMSKYLAKFSDTI